MSKKKLEYMKFCDERGMKVRYHGEILKREDKCKYLRSTVTENAKPNVKVFHLIESV